MRSEFEKTKTYGLCKSLQIDFDEDRKRYYSINPDLHVDVMSINSAFCMFQEQQPKVDELQKRVDELEFQLKDWKQKSMPAMLNGMCGHCGKEPLQGIVSDKEDYALLHCFSCGANKYEWIGEQALKGDHA